MLSVFDGKNRGEAVFLKAGNGRCSKWTLIHRHSQRQCHLVIATSSMYTLSKAVWPQKQATGLYLLENVVS